MKIRFLTLAALLASSTSAYAVGLDRSGQSIGILFQDGNRIELSFAYTDPTVEGSGATGPTGNVADTFLLAGVGLKYELNDKLSFAIIGDEPFGADTFYPNDQATSVLGGTGATVDSYAVTALARYKFNDNWSVHGGLRYQEVSASVTLDGLAFAASNILSYDGGFSSTGDLGFVVGAAYEIPEIALRVAVTYNSSTTHDLPTTETFTSPLGVVTSVPGATTQVETPDSINIDFQTGIAENTLVFGNLRYAMYEDTVVRPDVFTGLTGNSLTDLEDGFDFSIGIGRRFNEQWSGSVSVGYSSVGDDNLVSPLAPTNGSRFIAVGAKYDVNESFAIAGGVRYSQLGDAISSPGGTPVAPFEGNSAVTAGLRFEYKF